MKTQPEIKVTFEDESAITIKFEANKFSINFILEKSEIADFVENLNEQLSSKSEDYDLISFYHKGFSFILHWAKINELINKIKLLENQHLINVFLVPNGNARLKKTPLNEQIIEGKRVAGIESCYLDVDYDAYNCSYLPFPSKQDALDYIERKAV